MKHEPPPEIEISKGVFPPRPRVRWSQFFKQLEAGDSFLIADHNERNRVLTQAKRCGVPMTSIKISGVGYRLWRLAKQDDNFPGILRAA